ncbi:copper amine oxidase N-terminal domain-containing protein [Paenibacillus terreus]|uniref:Copper amine oxidase N-terminal domain-containing protein n=1 Tax=Paenibacillus terreus TaxID=1387834 RepID=A0ABV5BHC3_9BACL
MEQSFKIPMLFITSSCLLWLSASTAPTAYAGEASLVTEFPISENTGSVVTGTTKDIKGQTDFSVRIVKNGNEKENEPAYLVTGHGYRLLPLRAVAESVGFTVIWNQGTHSAKVRKGASWTTVQKDTDYYQYNDMEPISLGIAPVIIDGSLYVLEDFFSDVLKLSVEFEPEADALIISQK